MENEEYIPMSVEGGETAKLTYGGWLRFFRILNMSYIVLCVAAVLGVSGMFLYVEWDSNQEMVDAGIMFLELLPGFVFSLLIWKAVLIKSEDTPTRISGYLRAELTLNFLVYVVAFLLHTQGIYSEKPTPIIGSLIYYVIWSRYFLKSKRVLEFYGQNAG